MDAYKWMQERCSRWKKRFEKKKILIFVNSPCRMGKAAGLFSFDVRIDTKPSSFDNYYLVTKPLYPVKAFYDQSLRDGGNMICTVGSCLLGTDLYIIPDDKETPPFSVVDDHDGEKTTAVAAERLPSYVYDIRSEGGDPKRIPAAKKWGPLVAAIDNKIFALSAYSPWWDEATGNLFECLDSNNNNGDDGCWITLDTPKFPEYHYVTGFAVLENKFLLVSYNGREPGFLSYNVVSNQWKPVRNDYTSCDDDHTKIPSLAFESESVAVGRDIYTYDVYRGELSVFSCSFTSSTDDAAAEKEEFDLSVGSASPVRGFDFSHRYYLNNITYNDGSAAIAKAGRGGLLCLVRVLQRAVGGVQDICVTMLKLCGRDSCIHLESFKLSLFLGKEVLNPTLSACHVMDLKEMNKHRRVNQASRLHNNDNIAPDMEMDCGGNT